MFYSFHMMSIIKQPLNLIRWCYTNSRLATLMLSYTYEIQKVYVLLTIRKDILGQATIPYIILGI